MSEIFQRLASVKETIVKAAVIAGRAPDAVELIAVSKMNPPEAVRDAIDAGQLIFGESRVQEARVKIPMLPSKARWHFIGHLQKNKIRHALPLFELFHGIDSTALARDMGRIAEETGARPSILLEVNVADEASKFGFSPETLMREMEELLGFERLQIEGLMTIAPLAEEPEHSRKYFVALRELRDSLEREFRVALPRLSMGMSGDYAVAVEEGATLVRVGTAIFGERSAEVERLKAEG